MNTLILNDDAFEVFKMGAGYNLPLFEALQKACKTIPLKTIHDDVVKFANDGSWCDVSDMVFTSGFDAEIEELIDCWFCEEANDIAADAAQDVSPDAEQIGDLDFVAGFAIAGHLDDLLTDYLKKVGGLYI